MEGIETRALQFAAIPAWLDLINVYKFPIDSFHLQEPSTYYY